MRSFQVTVLHIPTEVFGPYIKKSVFPEFSYCSHCISLMWYNLLYSLFCGWSGIAVAQDTFFLHLIPSSFTCQRLALQQFSLCSPESLIFPLYWIFFHKHLKYSVISLNISMHMHTHSSSCTLSLLPFTAELLESVVHLHWLQFFSFPCLLNAPYTGHLPSTLY